MSLFSLRTSTCLLCLTYAQGVHVNHHEAKHVEAAFNKAMVLSVFSNHSASSDEAKHVEAAFDTVYRGLSKSFDFKAFEQAMETFNQGVDAYRGTDAYSSYKLYPDRPHCDVGVASSPGQVRGISPFPGGITQKSFGSSFAKTVHELSQEAHGPAAAGLAPVAALNSQSLKLGMGMVQSVVAALVHTVPPLIPPPTWNNQPLPCVPMVTGHNCFGAVLYPITMADFVLADVTDSMLDGVVAGFPNTYARKVGKTSDKMYKSCFASYMSMHCSSIFPRCTTPQSRDEPMPVGGRVPMCLHLCVMPLVMCPGFWVEDILGTCSMVSVPPLCTQAFFFNLWRLPPQYSNMDEAHPYPADCPSSLEADADQNPALYEAAPRAASPIMKEAVKANSVGTTA